LKRKAPLSPYEAQKAAAKRAALNALKRARRIADKAGVELSDWEGEFLGSVTERVKTFGRAFGDPEKGAPGQALSAMQAVKLKEIAAKAKGEKKGLQRKPFKRKSED
jgi:pyruvate/2-oxoglutarate dehydrogenase complex dihydrolipoamide acyltransferase (E2) component